MKDIVRKRRSAGGIGLLLVLSVLASQICYADSAVAPVSITRLDLRGDDYTLVVRPNPTDPPDRYMGSCQRFEVRGTYRSLRGWAHGQEPGLSRESHREALQFLQRAFVADKIVDLGWVGTGFVPVETGKPCIVKSLALRLLKDDRGEHVMSYHEAVSAPSE